MGSGEWFFFFLLPTPPPLSKLPAFVQNDANVATKIDRNTG
jgi:hypothetical protein